MSIWTNEWIGDCSLCGGRVMRLSKHTKENKPEIGQGRCSECSAIEKEPRYKQIIKMIKDKKSRKELND